MGSSALTDVGHGGFVCLRVALEIAARSRVYVNRNHIYFASSSECSFYNTMIMRGSGQSNSVSSALERFQDVADLIEADRKHSHQLFGVFMARGHAMTAIR